MDAWELLSKPQYEAVPDRFDELFACRPSMKREDWPGIAEPAPSLTYDISGIYGPDPVRFEVLVRDRNRQMLAAFRCAVPPAGKLYALDWRHECYTFRPHAPFDVDDLDAWAVPVLPNGDYYIFLAEDLGFGTFGHPWEQTICVFGRALFDAVAANKPRIFGTAVRQDGQPRTDLTDHRM